ncbi:response regulator [Altererythrobacter sp.]|uniref:response regulator n=1 Tax=Altererythrobacter sp. TaxID=1872480 RepID=UPI003CFED737
MFEHPPKSWSRKGKAAGASSDSFAGAAGLRVLLAEDTPISAEMMLTMAKHLSIDMDVASNGLDAIAMIEEAAADGRPYSLLLVDVMMPILDGVETTRRLRAQGIGEKELPIIAVTAATDLDEVRSYRAAGMQAFLEKPVGIEDLRSALRAWGHATAKGRSRLRSTAFEALREKFDQRKQQTLERIEHALSIEPAGEDIIMEIKHLLHQVAGTAGTFGEPKLSEDARRHEGELMAAYFGKGDVHAALEQAQASLRNKDHNGED